MKTMPCPPPARNLSPFPAGGRVREGGLILPARPAPAPAPWRAR